MSEEQRIPSEENNVNSGSGTDNTAADTGWQDVGKQFQALGESLAEAVRTAWQHEETQRRVQEMRMGIESMARQVGQAIDDTANSPQGQKIRQDANRAASSLRDATEQTVQEVRPQLIDALEQVNNELQKLISRMQQRSTQTPPPPGSGEPGGPDEGPGPQI